jgi:hypothetical protein
VRLPIAYHLTFEPDTIKIDGYYTSLLGKWITLNNTLAFLDASIVPINLFDTTGKFLHSIFDKGRGPKELTSPAFAYIKLTDNRYFYSNLSQEFKLVDSCNNIVENKSFLQMMFNADSISMDIIYNNPNYSMKSIYEINFTEPIYFNNTIIHPITTEHMKYNGYFKKIEQMTFTKIHTQWHLFYTITIALKLKNILDNFLQYIVIQLSPILKTTI